MRGQQIIRDEREWAGEIREVCHFDEPHFHPYQWARGGDQRVLNDVISLIAAKRPSVEQVSPCSGLI
jgi:hypothetical protein